MSHLALVNAAITVARGQTAMPLHAEAQVTLQIAGERDWNRSERTSR